MLAVVESEPELGTQKSCGRCATADPGTLPPDEGPGTWWPPDTEFFYFSGRDGLTSWCKACWTEYQRARGRKPRVVRTAFERREARRRQGREARRRRQQALMRATSPEDAA